MKTFSLLLVIGLLAVAVEAQDMTWIQLLNRPELWPTQCTLKKSLEFQSGKGVKAGQTVNILEMHPDKIVLGTTDGRMSFDVKPSDTDALAVANTAYAKLTPKQRELTYAAILKRPELWPWSVKLNDSFDIGGRRLRKGDTVYLMSVKQGELVVVPPTFNLHFELKPQDTDIMVYARKYVDDTNAAPGRLYQELQGKLVNAATGAAMPLNTNAMPRYYIIYHAARWCPYTQKFTPGLLKLYQEMKPRHPEFELIYVPVEKSAAELQLYAKEMSFPWPAIEYSKKEQLAVLAGVLGRSSTPELGVFDRYGNTIIDPAEVDRDTALKQLAVLWGDPPSAK
jgi:hypothetical protein